MMTIGYGDVTPVNNTERIYVIFMTLLSSGIFGYVVNTIGELYMQERQKIEQFQKRKQEITVYMDTRSIDSLSKLKVWDKLFLFCLSFVFKCIHFPDFFSPLGLELLGIRLPVQEEKGLRCLDALLGYPLDSSEWNLSEILREISLRE